MRSSWTLARRLRAALGVFSLLLVLAVVAIVVVLRQADRALTDQTQRIDPARVTASQLLTALVNQETALRGYALTGDRTFLSRYNAGAASEEQLRSRLDAMIGPEDPARLNLLTVDAAITAWRDEYASLRPEDAGHGSAASTIQFGRELFDRVRETNGALDDQLTKEVRDAQERADDDRRLVLVVLSLMALAVVLGLIGLQRALRTMVLRPMSGLAAQVAIVSQGDHGQQIRPEGPPDLRAMGDGVETMRVELVRALAEVEEQRRGLQLRAAELARSNADLEQFAYVASHDLQEPLRKVASFCQLIEQRYSGQLDERGEQYIAFAVDGAKRMQLLISDLLTFSRVGRTSEGFAPVDLGNAVARAWDGLDQVVQQTGAELEVTGCDHQVHGDAALLQVLFSNLLGNALKYRRPGLPPRVRVEARQQGQRLRVDVSDNGIGIPQEYAEKVFVIFQRLHGRDEYEGTGIGLALCKKIVEFHGGTIGLRPSALDGACVTFTLPLEAFGAP